MAGLADIMARARRTVAGRKAAPADDRRLVDVAITSAALIQRHGSAWLELKGQTAKQHLRVLAALVEAAYGSGLLAERERAEAARTLANLTSSGSRSEADLASDMRKVERVVEWAQQTATVAFAEVWAPWTFLLPQVSGIADDVLRGSPLLVFADVARRLDDRAAGRTPMRHDLFGASLDRARWAWPSKAPVAPPEVCPERDRRCETPAALSRRPASRGEGNVLSVQLLARALGPERHPGAQCLPAIVPHDGNVALLATPRGVV
jgi:hypothetical protein